MIPETKTVSIVLLCDLEGTVQEVIRDDLGITAEMPVLWQFTQLIDQSYRYKALSFLVELRTQGCAYDWELKIPVNEELAGFHFIGVATEDNFLIAGATTKRGFCQLCKGLMGKNGKQLSTLPAAIQDRAGLVRAQIERDSALYDELSRLNNELITLQRELAKRNAELERTNNQKNWFMGMAAHDLRNPLSAILAYSEFLLDEATDVLEEEQLDFLSLIHSSVQFMLQLVNDLLDVSAIESGQLQLNLQPTNLVDLMERNVALNQILAAKKQVHLTFHHAENIPNIALDGARIEQVLNNLISNAVKFSDPGSSVELYVTRQDNRAIISTRDEGPGIPAAELDSMFRWLGRTSVRSPAGEKSSGLGLTIAQRIVQEHQGEIWVESQAGQGATFYVALPID